MGIVRRDALRMVGGSIIAAAVGARSLDAPTRGKSKMTKLLPPFELQGTSASIASLAGDIAGFSVVRSGSSSFAVWFKGKDDQVRLISVEQRDALPMFEVFTLSVATPDEMLERWKDWKAPLVPDEVPEPFRSIMTTRPTAPNPPKDFDVWPFAQWRTEVLRRAEFIIEGVSAASTVGNNPNMQSAVRPTSVPPEASASCEVAVGFLFTGASGERLLVGVDEMPMWMTIIQSAAEIDEYLKPCEVVDLPSYLRRVSERT